MLAALLTVVGLVLVIVTTNIAGLLLGRGIARNGEVAVRRALGAGGGRLVRQLLTEALLLSAAGGVMGLGLAWALVAVFTATMPPAFVLDARVDRRVLAFAIAVCLGTGLLIGAAPALQATRVKILEALGSGIAGTRYARTRVRHWIVIPQVAICLVLLLVAGVHIRALFKIELTELGYATEGATVFRIRRWTPVDPLLNVLQATSDERRRASEDNATRMRAFNRATAEAACNVSGVSACGLAGALPLVSYGSLDPMVTRDAATTASALGTVVSGGNFDAMRIRLLAGRTFDSRDFYGTKRVALVSEEVARRLWPVGTAVGRFVGFETSNTGFARSGAPEWLEVIGVVSEVATVIGTLGERPRVYIPEQQLDAFPLLFQWRAPLLVVRGPRDRSVLAQAVKNAVIGADPFAEISSVSSIEQLVGEVLYPRRVAAAVLTTAGLIGLALATIGVYGVMSFSVAQRRREIGIRATLGADRADLLRLVLRDGARVIVIGGAVGFFLAVIALRLTVGMSPGLPLIDMVTFVGVPAILTAVMFAACYLPARRAARVNPVDVLRSS